MHANRDPRLRGDGTDVEGRADQISRCGEMKCEASAVADVVPSGVRYAASRMALLQTDSQSS